MILRIFLCAMLLCVAGTAHAQFVIEQAKVVAPVTGGDHLNDSVVIHNPTNEDVYVKVYWEDFKYKAPYDGSKEFAAAGTLPGSASAWVTYAPREFKIPANGKQRVEYTISVPAGIKGGHYGVLFFEKVIADPNAQIGMKIIYRMGSLFFIESKEKVKKGAFEEIKAGKDQLTGVFANQGDVVLIPQTTYYIMDASAFIIDRGDVTKLYVPPQEAAPFSVVLPKDMKPGAYTFVLNGDLEEGDVVVREIDLVKDSAGSIAVRAVR